jgi:hypothetical protein
MVRNGALLDLPEAPEHPVEELLKPLWATSNVEEQSKIVGARVKNCTAAQT